MRIGKVLCKQERGEMAVLLKNGAVFLHVPKTGGTWVTKVLYDLGLVEQEFGHQHADMVRVLHAYGFPVGKSSMGCPNASISHQIEISTYKFCFVRHLLSWYESWWRYMEEKEWIGWGKLDDKNHWHPCMTLNGMGHSDFNMFVTNVLTAHPGFVTELYSRYTDCGIHFVGRQESLAEDLLHVLCSMGLDVDLERVLRVPSINASFNSRKAVQWDKKVLAYAKKVEWPGLVRYGYEAKG